MSRDEEALATGEEAVKIRRQLAEANPDRYCPLLATSLSNLARTLVELDRYAQALPVIREAVGIYRDLAATNAGGQAAGLADALGMLGKVLASLHQSTGALTAVREAVTLYRDLADSDPGRRPELAVALANAGATLRSAGLPHEALRDALEAVTLYRDLAAAQSGPYNSELARSLNNLSSIYASLNRMAEALPAIEEAVSIRRVLVNTNADTFNGDLAHSLANFGPTLATLGRTTEALTASREAVTIYRQLAADNPDKYRTELDRALAALSVVESSTGRAATYVADSPLPRWPVVKAVGDDPTAELNGPSVMTFTMRLPFPLGLRDGGRYFFGVPGEWVDENALAVFGDTAIVVIRLCNIPIASKSPWPSHADEVLKQLYGFEDLPPEVDDEEDGIGGYEQWVSLETPNVRLNTDNPNDDGFAFHRCLEVLNRYLRAHYQLYNDVRVRPVTTHGIGEVVFFGAYRVGEDSSWQHLGSMAMHPDAYPLDPEQQDPNVTAADLATIYTQLDWQPFLRSADWRRRAQYARHYSGDNLEVVISLQVSMENMLYRLWGMLLIDLGSTYDEVITTINSGRGFRRLLTTVLPSLLGGRWDVTAADTPVGCYWKRVYQLHQHVLHNAHQPSWPEAEAAYEAYDGLLEFMNSRLWVKHKTYPRTLLAKLGAGGLRRRGWETKWMQDFQEKIRNEPGYFFLARDLTGRD